MLIDWSLLNRLYINESTRTGQSVKAWCKQKNLNYNTARRHIKPRTNLAQLEVRKTRCTKDTYCAHKNRCSKSNKYKNQLVNKNKLSTPENYCTLKKPLSGKRVASLGNQNARKHGHYATFVCTDDDMRRYLSAGKATLRDDLNILRVCQSNLILIMNKLQAYLKGDFFTAEQKVSASHIYDLFQITVDRRFARIESMENSLIKQAKIIADTQKSLSYARKTQLQADIMMRESGKHQMTMNEIYNDLVQLDDDGLLND